MSDAITRLRVDVAVVGGGPAGLAAALAAKAAGAEVLLVEREERLGGILKQCVHDGFGLVRYGEKLSGPEYARRFAREVESSGIALALETFVHEVRRLEDGRYALTCVDAAEGLRLIEAGALVLATGCRERTDRQVFIHGERPAGIMTAGLAQRLVNVEGLLPGRRAVILGSGDIGLIMARRLLLEGMEVEGVYEMKAEVSGLARNVQQCLVDFGIPLHLSRTVSEVRGDKRVEAVATVAVDGAGKPLPGTERLVECDTLVLSVGLIPENELALSLGLGLDPATKGPRADQGGATELPGLFACGNALHVNDLVDYVSESGESAGRSAADWALGRASRSADAAAPGIAASALRRIPLEAGKGFLYAVPQLVDPQGGAGALYFRSRGTLRNGGRVRLRAFGPGLPAEGSVLAEKRFSALRPPEMERLALDPASLPAGTERLMLELEAAERSAPSGPSSAAPGGARGADSGAGAAKEAVHA